MRVRVMWRRAFAPLAPPPSACQPAKPQKTHHVHYAALKSRRQAGPGAGQVAARQDTQYRLHECQRGLRSCLNRRCKRRGGGGGGGRHGKRARVRQHLRHSHMREGGACQVGTGACSAPDCRPTCCVLLLCSCQVVVQGHRQRRDVLREGRGSAALFPGCASTTFGAACRPVLPLAPPAAAAPPASPPSPPTRTLQAASRAAPTVPL